MRKLASIEVVWKIEPIEGADNIELAHVLGWQCVVNKGSFKPMDRGVYFEIDSFLPTEERYEFLRSSSYKKTDIMGEGFRLRTMKFRGQISQGLLLPLSKFPELTDDMPIGMAVADILKVRKWEIEERVTTGGTIKGHLPAAVPHTDETRVQAMPELIQEFAGKKYYISTKMDGSSHSICIDEDGFHVTGHNFEYKDDGSNSFYEFVKKNKLESAMQEIFDLAELKTFTIQGEFCGPGIQGNRLKLTSPHWYVFTIILNGVRANLKNTIWFCQKMGLETVPIEEIGEDLPSKYPTVNSLLERADGNYIGAGKKEGIVIRTIEPEYSALIGGPLSMKVVSNKYLLKNE